MLDVLHRIVQEVNAARDLDEALRIIVARVKTAISADVCSVYLTDFEAREHVLQATDGLRAEAVGRVRLPLHRGLIGRVCERAEPLNLADAPAHPSYLFVTETGETRYHGFLGVPVIQHRRVLGVLVVRQIEVRSFDDNEVTFLFTLAAQLAGAITHAQASGELEAPGGRSEEGAAHTLEGHRGAAGVAVGSAVVVYPPADLDAIPDRKSDDPAAEESLFRDAITVVKEELKGMAARVEDSLPAEDRALFDAWILMLSSDSLVGRTIALIQQGQWAQGALRTAVEEHARVFDKMEDIYLRERASDVRDLGRRILLHMQREVSTPRAYPDDTILVGEDVSPMQLAEVPVGRLVGIVSASGSGFSHVAILARGLGVPAVMGVEDLPAGRMDGQRVIADGYRGRVLISPPDPVYEEYRRLVEEDRQLSEKVESSLRGLPPETPDGVTLPLYLNAGLVAEVSMARTEETAGVGLYRTEMPFMVRDRFPGEEEQAQGYRQVLEAFAPLPVTLRTLDIGGDKALPYFPVTESNPFLGWRGIRISLDHPEIFLTQVRAMLRASVGLDNLRLLLPMISSVGEVDESLGLIHRAREELVEEGHAVNPPEIGVMIEVPAAVYQTSALARRVDFLSVGTNDLTQYLLAVDRNNARVAELYDDLHPAVLRSLIDVVEGAHGEDRKVSVCGEMAGDPAAVPLLLGMGVDELSVSENSLLRVKWVIRSFTRGRARALLRTALDCEDGATVRRIMCNALEDVGLGGLVRPGR